MSNSQGTYTFAAEIGDRSWNIELPYVIGGIKILNGEPCAEIAFDTGSLCHQLHEIGHRCGLEVVQADGQ